MNRLVLTIIGALAAILAAVGMGFYVYPQRPWLVWVLLLFCWLCYRLKRRAEIEFGARRQKQREADENADENAPPFAA